MARGVATQVWQGREYYSSGLRDWARFALPIKSRANITFHSKQKNSVLCINLPGEGDEACNQDTLGDIFHNSTSRCKDKQPTHVNQK